MSRDREDMASRTAGLRSIVDKARPLITSVRTIAIGSALAAAWLIILSYAWFQPDSWEWLPLGALFAVLILPVIVLTAFLIGLRQVIKLPQRIQEFGATGTESAAAAYQAVRPAADSAGRKRRVWRLFRALRDLQSAALEAKGTLLGYFAMAKLINPLAMGVVAVAVGAALGVIGFAGAATVVALLIQVF